MPIQRENQTLASITFQNYFRMYAQARRHDGHRRHRGVRVPADLPPRDDRHPDAHADGARGRERPGVPHARRRRSTRSSPTSRIATSAGQPVLVGTTSIENSELLSRHLDEGTPAARGAEREAARARGRDRRAGRARRRRSRSRPTWRAAAPTSCWAAAIEPHDPQAARRRPRCRTTEKERQIAQMRAEWQVRHDAVIAAGGLHIVGTERHESRRIDNQLRGRSGRQGDPGSSRFYLSLEDPLLRIFGGERLGVDHAEAQDARGRADRASDRQPLDREGAEPRRVAQLRHPQAAARIRRRRQRPAPRDLPAAQRAARVDGHRATRSAT